MKISITIPVSGGEPIIAHAEILQSGDYAKAERDAIKSALKKDPKSNVLNARVKLLEPTKDA